MEIRILKILSGLLVFLLSSSLFAQHPFFKQYTRSEGLFGNNVYDIHTAKNGVVWVGTNRGLVYFTDDKFNYPAQPNDLKTANVLEIVEDASHTIWVGTASGQLFRGNEKKGFTAFAIPNELQEVAQNKIINSLYAGPGDALYIGTVIGGGLFHLHNGTLEKIKQKDDVVASHFLTEVSSGQFIWGSQGTFPPNNLLKVTSLKKPPFIVQLSSKSGFSKSSVIRLKNGSILFAKDYEIIHLKEGQVVQRGFLPQKIEGLFESSDEKIWVALNKGGIVCYLTENLTSDLSSRYLSTKTITAISEDKEGNTWFSSLDEGVFMLPGKPDMHYSTPKVLITKPGEKSIASSFESNDSIAEKAEFISQEDSLPDLSATTLLPKNKLEETALPSVYISHIAINGQDTLVKDIYHLKHDENFISMNFAGFVNNLPDQLQYRYFLQGHDQEWIYTNTPQAQYSRLLPGEYVFILFAMDNNGVWSSSPAKITFFISPPFWNTWLFYALLIIALLLLVVLTLFWGLKRSREKAKMNKQSLLSELKVLRAQMNPHFTFNTLSSIQHFIGNNDNDAAIGYLSKFAKLMRSIMEHTKKQTIPVKDEISALKLYMDLEKLRLNGKFDYHVEIDPNIDEQYDEIPSLLIQPYVENAIWHGFTYKKEKGMIHIRLKRKNNFIICDIEDNGIGRAASKNMNGARSKHNSMGMEITKERLEIINALNNSPLSVNILDLQNKTGQPTGTKVEIFIPLEEEE